MITSSSPLVPTPNNPLQAGDMFGSSVAISAVTGSTPLAVVGTPPHNGKAGDAFVFGFTTSWSSQGGTPTTSDVDRTPIAGELFGTGVAVDSGFLPGVVNPPPTPVQGIVLAGAPGNSTTQANAGAFYEIILLKGLGTLCLTAAECQSGFCIDGVCCNTQCGSATTAGTSTLCQACNIPAQNAGGTVGTCGPARQGTQCNAALGQGCDRAAVCLANSTTCPPNPPMPASTICQLPSGVCDGTSYCDGFDGICPAHSVLPNTTVCRPAVGPCDLADNCDGTNPTCPADAKQPTTFVCHAATGACDLPETCSGTTNTCPADTFMPLGTVCHMQTSSCDQTEVCSGESPVCPFDAIQVNGAMCTGGTCQLGSCRQEADLALTMTSMVSSTLPVTVTATVQNNGPATAMSVQVQFALNDNATVQNGTLPSNCQLAGQNVTCTLPDMPSGTSQTITLMLDPGGGQSEFSVSGIATSAVFDPNPANNTATTLVQGAPIPSLDGGGFGCSMTPNGGASGAFGLFVLALLGLLVQRRRYA